jgi:hypothetical protein
MMQEDQNPKDKEKLYAAGRFFPAGIELEDGISVSVKDLYAVIFDFLSEPLKKYGFKLLKSKKTFSRKTESGVDEIQIHSIARNYFQFDFFFKKRIDDFQRIITAFNYANGFNTNSNFREQHTTWVCYSNIKKERIEAVTLPLFKKDLDTLLQFIENEIIPYFNKLENINFLNETLNEPDKDKNNHFSYFSRQKFDSALIDGLIVAKKLNLPNYQSLFDAHTRDKSQNESFIQKLLKLKDYNV